MRATSQGFNRFCKRIIAAAALPAVVAILGAATAHAGSIFTTDLDCKKVNGNIYSTKADVFLNGGPDGNGSALEPNTTYCILVSAPGGTQALNTIECRKTTDSTGHFECFNLFDCTGFADTDNAGGEYKVEACPLDGEAACVFRPDTQCKSDNFKVRASAFCVGDGCPLAISCPLDVNAECEGKNGAHVTYEAPIVIGGTAPVSVTCTPASGSLFPTGPTLVTCTATDSSVPTAQTDSCQFTVTVPDNCPGTCVFACGPDVPGGCGNSLSGGICGRTVTYFPPGCSGSTIECKPASGTFFAVGSTTVTCTATDPTDGTQTCTFKVIVTNPGAPVLAGCPSDTTVQCYGDVPAAATVTAKNACGDTVPVVPGVSQSKPGSSCNNVITRTWTATDACGNTASCTQTITVNDTTPPVITCPPDKAINSSDSIDPSNTGYATATDACSGVRIPTYSDSTAGGCPKIITRTWTATDACGKANSCKQKITVFCPGVVTDTMRCTLPTACAGSGPGINLIFTQDSVSPGCYKLNACNPGQFYDNVFYTGPANVAVTFTVQVPYPFVTQGSNPIEVYGSRTVSTSGGRTCYAPGPKLLAGSQQITLNSYTVKSFGSFATLTVTVPAALNNGFVWLAVHLDYGFKATTGYTKGSGSNATPCGSGTITIPNNQSYSFDGSSVSTCNTFKNLTGVGGLVVNSVSMYEMPGVPAVLKDSTGKTLATATTDQDGFYILNYKSPKATTLSVTITPSGYQAQTNSVSLKANGFAEVDFNCP